ncbi:hypothetical protein QT972_00245 [Microcoleus sp. herbarium7]|uniref:hypothetical protein n=1 Tax=Microcoleus sp. herbarium7 TaxID=3055435 RepID=UPI002FD39E11
MKTYKIGDLVAWDSAIGTITGKIKDSFDSGLIPGIQAKINCSFENPGYLIELENSDRQGILIGKNASDLRLEVFNDLNLEVTTFPKLSLQQISKLNQFIPAGFPKPNPEDLTVIDFVVADNLVNRGRGKWREKDLIILAKMLNTMGIPHTLDHDWEDIEKTQGLVIEGKIFKNTIAPENLVSSAGNKDLNSEIVKKEGFVQVIAAVVFLIDSPIVQRLSMGIGRAVSLGGFAFEDYVCPICETSFTYKNCPHYIPGGWDAWREDPNLVAPYYIRDGLYDLGELSSVLIANLPGATAVVGNGI